MAYGTSRFTRSGTASVAAMATVSPVATPVPASVSIAPARTEFGNSVTTGRVTLAVLDALALGVVGFYIWTRGAQGGG